MQKNRRHGRCRIATARLEISHILKTALSYSSIDKTLAPIIMVNCHPAWYMNDSCSVILNDDCAHPEDFPSRETIQMCVQYLHIHVALILYCMYSCYDAEFIAVWTTPDIVNLVPYSVSRRTCLHIYDLLGCCWKVVLLTTSSFTTNLTSITPSGLWVAHPGAISVLIWVKVNPVPLLF